MSRFITINMELKLTRRWNKTLQKCKNFFLSIFHPLTCMEMDNGELKSCLFSPSSASTPLLLRVCECVFNKVIWGEGRGREDTCLTAVMRPPWVIHTPSTTLCNISLYFTALCDTIMYKWVTINHMINFNASLHVATMLYYTDVVL